MCACQTHRPRPRRHSATDWTAETERGGVGGALGDLALESKGNPAPTSHGCPIRFDSSRKQANHLAGTNTQDIRAGETAKPPVSVFLSSSLSVSAYFFGACSLKLIIIIISYYNTCAFIIRISSLLKRLIKIIERYYMYIYTYCLSDFYMVILSHVKKC